MPARLGPAGYNSIREADEHDEHDAAPVLYATDCAPDAETLELLDDCFAGHAVITLDDLRDEIDDAWGIRIGVPTLRDVARGLDPEPQVINRTIVLTYAEAASILDEVVAWDDDDDE